MKLYHLMIVVSCLFLCCGTAQGQSLSPAQIKTLDALFEEMNPEAPGVSLGLMKDGALIYSKSMGMANMETERPNTPKTLYQISYLSTQFVSFGLMLLEEQGKVDMDTDITTVLPSLKKFNYPIKVRHLINHTSGLRDYITMKELMGWRPEDSFNHGDLMSIINAQDQLMFEPGTQAMTSYTNTSLMVDIIEAVSEQSLEEFTKTYILTPLSMKHSGFNLDPNDSQLDIATGYTVGENGVDRVVDQMHVNGPTNFYTSIEEMAIWVGEMYRPRVFSRSLVDRFLSFVKTDSGETYGPNLGMMTMSQHYKHLERGVDIFWNYGVNGGYGNTFFWFIDDEIMSFAFSNNSQYTGMYSMTAATSLIEDTLPEPQINDYNALQTFDHSKEQLASFCGDYLNTKSHLAREIRLENDTLYLIGNGRNNTALIPVDQSVFQLMVQDEANLYITFRKEGGIDKFYFKAAGDASEYSRYTPESLSMAQAESLVGSYYNADYGLMYRVTYEDDQVTIHHFKNGPIPLTYIHEDLFHSLGNIWRVDFERNENGDVIGLQLSSRRVEGVPCVKIGKVEEVGNG